MNEIAKSDIAKRFAGLAVDGLEILELEVHPNSTITLVLLEKQHEVSVAKKYALQFMRILDCDMTIAATPYLGSVSGHRLYSQSAYVARCLERVSPPLSEPLYHFEVEVESDRSKGKLIVVAADFVWSLIQVLPRARAPGRGLH